MYRRMTAQEMCLHTSPKLLSDYIVELIHEPGSYFIAKCYFDDEHGVCFLLRDGRKFSRQFITWALVPTEALHSFKEVNFDQIRESREGNEGFLFLELLEMVGELATCIRTEDETRLMTEVIGKMVINLTHIADLFEYKIEDCIKNKFG